MEYKTQEKRVPWSQLQQYLMTHQTEVSSLIELEKLNILSIPEIEARLPKSFVQLHEVITKILKDNSILQNEEGLQATVDELTAKNLELEAKLK
jgi:hypothetical protein